MYVDAAAEISLDVFRTLSRFLTGRLLTEGQIKAVTGHVVGKHFADWLPKPEAERLAEDRVAAARTHLSEATRIMSSLRDDLDGQTHQLEAIATTLAQKKDEAERYAKLAALNQEAYAPLKAEMQESLRTELEAQANKGRRVRQAVGFVVWLLTLILGAYVPQIVKWANDTFSAKNPAAISVPQHPAPSDTVAPNVIPRRR